MADTSFIAFDLGAESGRAFVGSLSEGRLDYRQLHRFLNTPIFLENHWHWDLFSLFQEIKNGLSAASRENIPIRSAAVDTWGVDFGFLDAGGSILGLPYIYRDHKNDGMLEEFSRRMSLERVYDLTGIQLMQINSLFQLYSCRKLDLPELNSAASLLFMPDLFNYLLTGIKRNEFTISTTSQLYNPLARRWEKELFEAADVSADLMQEIINPGTTLGPLLPEVCADTGQKALDVVAVASHDTGSAVAAIPAGDRPWAFISTGTWCLMGIESQAPIINDTTRRFNFTNEGGVEGTYRILKNTMGFWLVQQCRKSWSSREYDYAQLVSLARQSAPFRAFIDINHPSFLNPDDMPAALASFCAATGQRSPDSHGGIARMIFEGLAFKFKEVLIQLNQIASRPIETIYMIGGGINNDLVCQFTADATGLPVVATLEEATVVGNLMMQARGMGYIRSLSELRKIVGRSFPQTFYEPRDHELWEDEYRRYCTTISQKR